MSSVLRSVRKRKKGRTRSCLWVQTSLHLPSRITRKDGKSYPIVR